MPTKTEKGESYLSHHGVLGMRWGHHLPGRGDNPSSSTTVKPRKLSAPKRQEPHQDHVDSRALIRNKTRTLSTSELKKVNDRLQTERKYRELNPDTANRGKKVVLGIIGAAGTGVTVYNLVKSPAGKAAVALGQKAVNKTTLKVAETIVKTL